MKGNEIMFDYYNPEEEEKLREEELEEAENMIRSGCNTRQIMRKRFTFLGQSDIFKLFRKYGMDMNAGDNEPW